MKVAFISLGCAKNLVNTEQMMALCRKAGHTITGEPEGADVAVLNTCGFIESAKSEAIDNILQLGRLKEEGKLKKLLVAGGLTQRYPDDIRKELPEVDGMLGTGSYTDVVAAVEELMAGEKAEHFAGIHTTYEDGERIVTTETYDNLNVGDFYEKLTTYRDALNGTEESDSTSDTQDTSGSDTQTQGETSDTQADANTQEGDADTGTTEGEADAAGTGDTTTEEATTCPLPPPGPGTGPGGVLSAGRKFFPVPGRK
mgnify:CR=1 FL=1